MVSYFYWSLQTGWFAHDHHAEYTVVDRNVTTERCRRDTRCIKEPKPQTEEKEVDHHRRTTIERTVFSALISSFS
ncbi:jg20281 [Pararge aegeria aegeria]|uniref:Jg20281 protein n=1 Tax=Pararge aegeria aegeria TaxID=348720 RepID=A0A8S4QNA5_9NEOP|nr:jg20281 [Pararge aegeria aegeria]